MRTFSRPEAIARMNRLGAAKEPFVFVVDYLQRHTHIERATDVDPTEWLYNLNGFTNQATAATMPLAAEMPPYSQPASYKEHEAFETEPLRWDIFPEPEVVYAAAFAQVKTEILAGNSYLANLTRRTPIRTNRTLQTLFYEAEAPYKIWLKDRFVCFSPECFVRIANGQIRTYPMKGTADAALIDAAQRLLADTKEEAEHATIVDLLRNDLSQVATEVTVSRYRYLEKILTPAGGLWQTSSEITGRLAPGWEIRLGDILYSLLPAGSITGAPKKKTCEIIASAESHPRGYYTGIAGYFDGRKLDTTVLIRFIEQAGPHLYFHSGGGITSQSQQHNEYREMIQKINLPRSHP